MNINTILLTIVLGLSGWTLQTVTTIREKQAAMAERLDGAMARITALEVQVNTLSSGLIQRYGTPPKANAYEH